MFDGVDERESVQKKTFAKWVNSHLIRVNCSIQDLYVDLRDGKMLIKLLEVLSGERLVRCCCSPITIMMCPELRPLTHALETGYRNRCH